MIFKPRLDANDIKGSKWYTRPYSVADDPATGMPNCTAYVMYRWAEQLQKQFIQNLGGNRCDNPLFDRDGFPDACDWYKLCRYEKGQTPKLGAIACWSGAYKSTGKPCKGHVAHVEAIYADGSYLTSNSNYTRDSRYMDANYFFTKKIPANNHLESNVYNFKFEGFLYIPIDYSEVERDENKHQVRVVVDGLRIREGHSTNDKVLGLCTNGQLFNVLEKHDDGTYVWFNIEDGWIATKPEWIEEYLPKQESLQGEINELKEQLREEKLVNANLRNMLNTCEEGAKLLNEKLDKIREIAK